MNGASPVRAASRNGVAPISLKLVLFKLRRLVIGFVEVRAVRRELL